MNTHACDPVIRQILQESKNRLVAYWQIDEQWFDRLLPAAAVSKELAGHNSRVCLIDFRDDKKNIIGSICVKRPLTGKMMADYAVEKNILNLLNAQASICPRLISSGVQKPSNTPYLVTEIVHGVLANQTSLDLNTIRSVLNAVHFHETVLRQNIERLDHGLINQNWDHDIDYAKKISSWLRSFSPGFTINAPLDFLNSYLNHPATKNRRTVATDRSAKNIFYDQNDKIMFIDFSTIRIGSQFDNWIQFTDDPRARFSCTKENLIRMFFEFNNLGQEDMKYYYAAAVYTNLLQGIFTYWTDRDLGTGYFMNANRAYMELTDKKSVLLGLNPQHT